MKPSVALILLDGFGYREETYGNAIYQSDMKYYQSLWNQYPHSKLGASGLAVGLPNGQMGNSEVGHLNIGAGRVVYQTLTKIDKEIESGEFYGNPVLNQSLYHVIKEKSKLHLMGLFSDGGVHSHLNHFYALLKMAKDKGIQEVYIHALLDGRDVPPSSAMDYFQDFEKQASQIGIGKIASISGRYYGMDRDNRWDRVEKYFDAITSGVGNTALSPKDCIEKSYADQKTDEFVIPTLIVNNQKPMALIEEKDSVIFVNFRPDRAREITQALALKDFKGFQRKKNPQILFTCMAEYDKSYQLPIAFVPEDMKNILSEVLANHKKSQLRIAETEKYAHVTFFFNGQVEKEFPQEERVLIPSPKVATYDLKPEMSAIEVTEELVKRIQSKKYDVIICNYANPDMVGHTGNMTATIAALKTLDNCLEKVVAELLKNGSMVMITADHGNADEMFDHNNNIITAHTTNDVPFILISPENNIKVREKGILADIAPTMLELIGIEKPKEMTGSSLIKK